jgi:hypothetical protein
MAGAYSAWDPPMSYSSVAFMTWEFITAARTNASVMMTSTTPFHVQLDTTSGEGAKLMGGAQLWAGLAQATMGTLACVARATSRRSWKCSVQSKCLDHAANQLLFVNRRAGLLIGFLDRKFVDFNDSKPCVKMEICAQLQQVDFSITALCWSAFFNWLHDSICIH